MKLVHNEHNSTLIAGSLNETPRREGLARRLLILAAALFLCVPCFAETDYSTYSSCVGYWPMEQTGNETETSGNGADLTAATTIDRSSTKVVGSYSRDFERGDNDRFTQADGESTDLSGANQEMTIAFWYRPESVPAAGETHTLISKNYPQASDRQFRLFIYGEASGGPVTPRLTAEVSYDGTTYYQAYGDTALEVDTWYYIALVYESVSFSTGAPALTIYINAVVDSNGTHNPFFFESGATYGLFDSNEQFYVGAQNYGGGIVDAADGLMDDLIMFNTNVGIGVIQEMYECGADGSLCAVADANVEEDILFF